MKIFIKKYSWFALVLSFSSLHAQDTFTLISKTLGGNATTKEEFNGFGCSGNNISPQLSWVNAPKETKSFAVTMYDPDAPTGSGWWHWLIFDLAASTFLLNERAGDISKMEAPKNAIQSLNDYSNYGYGGPCPPKGDGLHRYVFTVYALGVESLGLDKNTNAAVVGYYLNNNAIAKASLISYYKR